MKYRLKIVLLLIGTQLPISVANQTTSDSNNEKRYQCSTIDTPQTCQTCETKHSRTTCEIKCASCRRRDGKCGPKETKLQIDLDDIDDIAVEVNDDGELELIDIS